MSKEQKLETLRIYAEHLDDLGIDSSAIRGEAVNAMIGERIAVYGPNYIWRGLLAGVTPSDLILDDVYQIRDSDHDAGTCEDMFFSPRQIIPRTAICNFGPCSWA